MKVPEGVETITSTGGDLKQAVAAAADQLGLASNQVDYKLDLSHFRSSTGVSVSRSTVQIIAWASGRDAEEEPPKAEKKPRKERNTDRDSTDRPKRERKRRGRRGDDEERSDGPLKGAASGTSEASEWAQGWFATVLEHMDLQGEVVATGDEERVHLGVKVDKAGRLIGRRGATLGAIRHLLGQALATKFGELVVDVDVADDRDDRDSRGSDRGREKSRSRDRKRGDRDRKRDDRRRGGRRRSGDKNGYPEEKLQALARRAASKARESGQTITIKLNLNSYDRRLVHVEIAEIDGVDSQSEERTITDDDGLETTVKYVQVFPTED